MSFPSYDYDYDEQWEFLDAYELGEGYPCDDFDESYDAYEDYDDPYYMEDDYEYYE